MGVMHLIRWWLLAAVLGLPANLYGQFSNGYVVGGIGSRDERLTSQAAVGGEWLFSGSFGVGGEVGAIFGHTSFGVFSVNGYYHFPVSAGGVVGPFATAGYTRATNLLDGTNAFNGGAGLHYWFYRRLGVRAEFRDFASSGLSHFWGFRVGFVFH
jgi:hypothetical protein